MIQHLRIDQPPLINSQTLSDLGRVNILTGRNSSGKSTILRSILEKPEAGITYRRLPETESRIRSGIPDYTKPSERDIDDWVSEILDILDGTTLFAGSVNEAYELVDKAQKSSAASGYSLVTTVRQIANALVSLTPEGGKPVLLSPKRRLPYETEANVMHKLDSEAIGALSRLFYLKNQMPDSLDRRIFDKIHESFREITGSEFHVQVLGDRHPPGIQLQFRRIGGSWIVAQNEGLGLTEVLSILLYSLDGTHQLLLIEEPENHLHPDFQRRLLSFLNSVEDRQFILTTHSPVFLNPTMVDRIYLCKYEGAEIKIDDHTSRMDALSDIGVLAIDNLTSDVVLMTEGKNDIIVIEHIVRKWLSASPAASISPVFLSGSMMMYFDPTPFAENRNTFALLDRDTTNSSAQKAFLAACHKISLIPTQLTRYCIENYYTLDALRATFGDLIPSEVKALDNKIPPWKQLADAIHDENWWKGELKSARRISRIMRHMADSDLEGTDLFDFCKKIRSTI
ncbi:MAG: AAA family ATPase [Bacteroidota bacterium]